MPTIAHPVESFMPTRYRTTVGGVDCVVRAATVWPIPEVLDLDGQFEPGQFDPGEASIADDELLADLLASRMIAPPRPRRRRERSVSSRAVFFSASSDG